MPKLMSWLFFKPETLSTSDDAFLLASQGAAEGTIVFTDYQIQGRGRFGRRWSAPRESSILMSLVLRPRIPPGEYALLTLLCSVAVATAISDHLGLPARIKWPNDILLRGEKVSGILVEIGEDRFGEPFAVVGIGVNVNRCRISPSTESDDRFVTLSDFKGSPVDRFGLMDAVVRELDRRYSRFSSGDRKGILDEYRSLSVTLGNPIEVTSDGRRFFGWAVDIGSFGELIVRLPNGGIEKFYSGDTSVVKQDR